ncbi:MAG: hypothetical protein ACRC1K_14925 [Planctomycetia bacterium]
MGATSWRYYTRYDPDPEAALLALREEVFARGEFTEPADGFEEEIRRTARRMGQDPDGPAARAMIDSHRRVLQALQTGEMRGLRRDELRRVQWLREMDPSAGSPGPTPVAGATRPRSIAELLEQAAESGTHSILDIEQTNPRPKAGAAAPLPTGSLRKLFGTTEPTREQVEQQWLDVAEPLGRWQARYLVVYKDGKPNEYAFIGCSGD